MECVTLPVSFLERSWGLDRTFSYPHTRRRHCRKVVSSNHNRQPHRYTNQRTREQNPAKITKTVYEREWMRWKQGIYIKESAERKNSNAKRLDFGYDHGAMENARHILPFCHMRSQPLRSLGSGRLQGPLTPQRQAGQKPSSCSSQRWMSSNCYLRRFPQQQWRHGKRGLWTTKP